MKNEDLLSSQRLPCSLLVIRENQTDMAYKIASCRKNGVLAVEESPDTISDSRVTQSQLRLPFGDLLTAVGGSTEPGR